MSEKTKAYVFALGIQIASMIYGGLIVIASDDWFVGGFLLLMAFAWFNWIRWANHQIHLAFFIGAVYGAKGGGSDVDPWEVIEKRIKERRRQRDDQV